MPREAGKKLSLGKRLAGLLLIGCVLLVSIVGTHLIMGPLAEPIGNPAEELKGLDIVVHVVLMFLAAFFFLGTGAGVYVVTLWTRCFTFNFRKPFWKPLMGKLYVMNIAVLVPIGMGAAAVGSMVVTPVLVVIGLPWNASMIAPLLGIFVLAQYLMIWVNIWRPLEPSLIKRRLAFCGVSDQDIARGVYVGISDPEKSSFRKMFMVEEDVGMLWLEDNELVYKGDTQSFTISHEQLIEVERATDAGSMAAYFGNVNVILWFRTGDGGERRVRLHSEGAWTMSSRARASDRLAEMLADWKQE